MIRKDIKTRILADGSQLTIPVFYFPGKDAKAKKAYIQSGIHGSEVQGYLVALHLIEELLKNPPQGDVTIVPIANPYGLNVKLGEYTLGRFDPVTGENWNRNYLDLSFLVSEFLEKNIGASFEDLLPLLKTRMVNYIQQKLDSTPQSYSKKIALQLQQLALEADIVLDLHCDTVCVPHMYCPSYAMESATHLGIPFIIEIPHAFGGALDEATFAPWIQLTQQYNEENQTYYIPPIEAFTVELGNQEILHEEAATNYARRILWYLYNRGVLKKMDLECPDIKEIYSCRLENFKTIYASCGGLITYYGPLGMPLGPKDILYKLHKVGDFHVNQLINHDFIGNSTLCDYSLEESIILTHSASPIVHEGMATMKIMTKFQLIK